jgi:CHASE2 domain-containing sensor protein
MRGMAVWRYYMITRKQKRKIQRSVKLVGFGISILLSLLVLVSYILSQTEFHVLRSAGMLDLIEAKTLDLRFRIRGERHPGNEIVIIAMDEKTEDVLGRWQSAGRHWIAQLVDILYKGEAKVIGFDVTLAEPDQNAALEAVETLKTLYLESVQDPTGHPPPFFDDVKAMYDYD